MSGFHSQPTPKASTKEATSIPRGHRQAFEDWHVGDEYEIIQMLGQGAYGEVAKARVKRLVYIYIFVLYLYSFY